MQPFYALISPMQGGGGQPPYPDQGLPGPQPGYGPRPDNTLPGQPPGIWGGGNVPMPTPPIYNPGGGGGQPPGIWGGGNVPMPTPPIYFPPEGGQPPQGNWGPPRPDHTLPGEPPRPTHPIVLPPGLPPELPDLGPIKWLTGWTPQTGWVVVGIPNLPHPAPSYQR
jgi:hypothetical protein